MRKWINLIEASAPRALDNSHQARIHALFSEIGYEISAGIRDGEIEQSSIEMQEQLHQEDGGSWICSLHAGFVPSDIHTYRGGHYQPRSPDQFH